MFNIGKRALDAGQLTLAERCYQTLVIWDPDYDKAFVNLSAALNRQEKFAATLAVLEPRTDLLAKNHKLAINLAEAHHALGNNQQVITLLEPLQAERLLSEEAQLVLADSNRKFVRGSDLSHE